MSTQRIVDYWHTPVPQPFVDYVLQRANLSGDYLKIAKNFRADQQGDTAFYADAAHLDKANFGRKAGTMHRAVMAVLIELAVDGWKARTTPRRL